MISNITYQPNSVTMSHNFPLKASLTPPKIVIMLCKSLLISYIFSYISFTVLAPLLCDALEAG